MNSIYPEPMQLVGNTPVVRLKKDVLIHLFPELDFIKRASIEVYAKLEKYNPLGSVKDRPVLYMIRDLIDKGRLRPGMSVIEPTSGNTGIAIAWMSSLFGFKAVIVMPESMSEQRKRILRLLGAELILTKAELGMQGAIDEANRLLKGNDNAVMLGQFTNPLNPIAHYKTTGPEIWTQFNGEVGAVVAGIGTGGTISGVGRFLKERDKKVKIIGVEPRSFPHRIQGIGAGFVPEILDNSVIDGVVKVDDSCVLETFETFPKASGLLVGLSSCAVLIGLRDFLLDNRDVSGNIVLIFADTGERYL